MNKIVTAFTVFNTGEGTRISIIYSKVDETGKIISDASRVDRIILDNDIISVSEELKEYAQSIVNSIEGD